jgi:Zn finger protein HypA/HybF involved in hydrogenase expression
MAFVKNCKQCGGEFRTTSFRRVVMCPKCRDDDRNASLATAVPGLIASLETWKARALKAERELSKLRPD